MGKSSFQFKQFTIDQDQCAMKVTTDSCLFGAWTAYALHQPNRILDIGAGTGLLSLMLAQSTGANIDAVEIESSCFHQLKENVDRSPFSKRINPIHLDIKDHKERGYDMIISNPPFHQHQLISDDKRINYARHEEGLTLEQLFEIATNLMTEKGCLFILLPHYRKTEALDMATSMNWFPTKITTVLHSKEHLPFRTMFMFTKEVCSCLEDDICIYDGQEKYSDVFSKLLHPYYLYL